MGTSPKGKNVTRDNSKVLKSNRRSSDNNNICLRLLGAILVFLILFFYYFIVDYGDHTISIKVISLPSRTVSVLSRFSTFNNFNFDIVRGFNGEHLDLHDLYACNYIDDRWDKPIVNNISTRLYIYGIPNVTAGEVACSLAHRKAIKEFFKYDYSTRRQNYLFMMEDDATPVIDEAIDILKDVQKSVDLTYWNYIQFGRCYDIWCNVQSKPEKLISTIHSKDGKNNYNLYESRGYELCSHSYLLTGHGAKIVLNYTIPYTLPYDHLIMLLCRNKILKCLYMSPRLFDQENHTYSNVREIGRSVPECHPDAIYEIEKFHNVSIYDNAILQSIQNIPPNINIDKNVRKDCKQYL